MPALAALLLGQLLRRGAAGEETIEAGVHLRKPASELRLGRGDERARRLVEKLPGASL